MAWRKRIFKKPYYKKRRYITKRYDDDNYDKGKKIANKVFRKARSIYNKRRKGQRLYNVGKFNLMKNISSGGRLPFETTCVMFYRHQQEQTFRNTALENKNRTLNMNTIRYPLANTSDMAGGVELNKYQWIGMLRQMYQEYCITGAKVLIEIKPIVWNYFLITSQKTVGVDPENIEQDYTVPANITFGYWYVRVFYRKKNGALQIDQDMNVGGFMNTPNTPTMAGVGTERIWRTRRDFLSDPTVSYVRDRTTKREKIHQSVNNPSLIGAGIGGNGTSSAFGASASTQGTERIEYEMERDTRTITLKQYFSYRKHIGDKNWRNNITWYPIGTGEVDASGPSFPDNFQCRIGYIGFTGDGSSSYHVPIDRNNKRDVTWNMTCRIRLRKPRLGPDGALQVQGFADNMGNNYVTTEIENSESPHQLQKSGTESPPQEGFTHKWDSEGVEIDSESDFSEEEDNLQSEIESESEEDIVSLA